MILPSSRRLKHIALVLIILIAQFMPFSILDHQALGQTLAVLPVAEDKPVVKVIKTGTYNITAYNSEVGQTDNEPCITANGYNLCTSGEDNTIAANFLKFGTKVRIPELYGDKVFIVRDRMNSRYTRTVDIWMPEHSDAVNFGLQVATIQVIE